MCKQMLMVAKIVDMSYDIQIPLSMMYKMRGQPTSGDQPFTFERQKPRACEKPEFTHIFADDPKKC